MSKSGEPWVYTNQVGDVYDQHYAAFRFMKPNKDLPAFDHAIVSVAGFNISATDIELNVCWESLVPTLKAVFVKTKKKITVIAAGRKLLEPEGSRFLSLCELRLLTPGAARELTIAIDDAIDGQQNDRFQTKITQLSDHLGPSRKKDGIIYWRTMI
jgi:hypothetical protein